MLRKVDISKITGRADHMDDKEMIGSLAIPSMTMGYSLCIEYAKKWLFKHIHQDFFKGNVYVEGRYALNDLRYRDIESQMKKDNPALAIVPEFDVQYNREFVDFTPNMYGIDNFIRRSKFDKPFFKDYDHHIHLYLTSRALQVNFTYKIRLDTRAQQTDLAEFMKIAYKSGATSGEYIDQDYHIPYYLMINIAKDTGFEVKDNVIVDPVSFLRYLNAHSQIPITYKFRGSNGHEEFFLRMMDQYVHTRTNGVDKDNGDRRNHIETNFGIEMTTTVTYPIPQFYVYYSTVDHGTSIPLLDKETERYIGIYSIDLSSIPSKNSKGWMLYLTTDILEEDTTKNLYIDSIDVLFRSTEAETDIQKVLNYNKKRLISSDVFIDVQLFNGGKRISNKIDWDTYSLTTYEKPTQTRSIMAIYIDLEYMNNCLAELNNINEARVK